MIDLAKWAENLRDDLAALSDLDYQKACFSGLIRSADTSPSEMIATLCTDDLLADYATNYLSGEKRRLALELVRQLGTASKNVRDKSWEEVLSSDEWLNIVELSRRLSLLWDRSED